MEKIHTFTLDETRFLSNFYPHKKGNTFYPHKIKVTYEGMEFDCVENAYQAAKSLDVEIRKQLQQMTAYEAKAFSEGGYEIRPDWKQVKYGIMFNLVWQKFNNHEALKNMLLETGNCILEEGNTWDDTFWGICDGVGENNLGKLLMHIRKILRQQQQKKINAVLFDFDGVFWDSEYIWVGSLYHIINQKGFDISYKEAFSLFAGTSYKTKKEEILSRYGFDISDVECNDIIQTKEIELQKESVPTDNLKAIFEYIKEQKLNMYIVTGAPIIKVLERIKNWGFDNFFNEYNIITSNEIEEFGLNGKPAPDIYLYAAKKWGYELCECLIVEDSKQGISSAVSSEMITFAFLEHQENKEELTQWCGYEGVSCISNNVSELLHNMKSFF